jgi:hypothetical protein
MDTRLLKPGILVSLKTTLSGGVNYDRRDLGTKTVGGDEQEEVSKWETVRTIRDREEHDKGVKVRSTASSLIRRECIVSSFGLLCLTEKEAALDEAIQIGRDLADAFNEDAKHTQFNVYVLKGRIAETDEEATRAIAAEVRGLLDEMESGVRNLDVKSIREAANRARELNKMIDDSQSERMGAAIKAARKAARTIVKRVEKAKETGEAVLADIDTKAINVARFAFLDPEAEEEKGADVIQLPGVDPRRFAELDPAQEAQADEGDASDAV